MAWFWWLATPGSAYGTLPRKIPTSQTLSCQLVTMPRQSQSIDFDKILGHVGPIGPWQYIHLFTLFLVTMCAGIAVVTFAFTGFVPAYRCSIPECEDLNHTSYYR